MQIPYNTLPAVVIGGPPHSGKSVLAHSLTVALRQLDAPHYVLRAYPPDGEGDWFHEGIRETVQVLRRKRGPEGDWITPLVSAITHRHLPLLVDFGGLPSEEQEAALDACTHAILLTPDETSRVQWLRRFERHGLVLLADLRSELHGTNTLESRAPLLCGTLAGLERGSPATGPAFAALVTRLALTFGVAAKGIVHRHLVEAPVELAADLDAVARALGFEGRRWEPADVPALLDYLPGGQPLALYGRGPAWLYAAAAVHASPAPFYSFDAALGWVSVPDLGWGVPASRAVALTPTPLADATWLEVLLEPAYLSRTELDGARLGAPPSASEGLVISGQLPLWLWAGLARLIAPNVPWLAAYQPQLEGAVVVASADPDRPLGDLVPSR